LDYSDRDFEALKLRLQGLARTVFPDWTDFNTANFGNILMELFCFVGDVLHFYQDRQAAEAFTPTLTQRTSMIRLGQLINFTLTGAAAASGTATVALRAVSAESLAIPRGTRLSSSDPQDPVPFQTTAVATLTAGSTSVPVAIEQSERRFESFDSAEEPNQEVILSHTPFLDGSMSLVERDGGDLLYGMTAVDGDYHRVDSFLGCNSTDRVFTTLVDHLDRCHVRFGNGVTGAIPQGEMNFAYKIGGGAKGCVEAGRVSVLVDNLTFPSGSPAPVTVTNAAATSGGVDRMGLEEAKVQAPAALRVLNRTVTRDDFESVARSVRGVARALMATCNEYAGIPENAGQLYVVARGIKLASGRIASGPPSTSMLAQVRTAIDVGKPPTITFTYEPMAAVMKTISVETRIYLAKGANSATVALAIWESLKDFFAAQLADGTDNTDIDFGANLLDVNDLIVGEITWSDVMNAIRDVPGVRKVDESAQGVLLNDRHASVVLTPVEFPQLGAVTIVDANTNLTILAG
jgi:hypothetical protein